MAAATPQALYDQKMDGLRKTFPSVPSEDLESALGYAEGDVLLATVIVQSALDVHVQPRILRYSECPLRLEWGKTRVLGNVDQGKGDDKSESSKGRRTPRPYSFTRSISEPNTSTRSKTVSEARSPLAQRNDSSTSLPQTKTSALPGSYTPHPNTAADEDTIEWFPLFIS